MDLADKLFVSKGTPFLCAKVQLKPDYTKMEKYVNNKGFLGDMQRIWTDLREKVKIFQKNNFARM